MKYENRKTGEIATVVSTDEKAKTIMLEKSDGKTVSMSMPSLRKSWKKVEEEETVTTDTQEVVEETVTKEVVTEPDTSNNLKAKTSDYAKLYDDVIKLCKDKGCSVVTKSRYTKLLYNNHFVGIVFVDKTGLNFRISADNAKAILNIEPNSIVNKRLSHRYTFKSYDDTIEVIINTIMN